MTTWSILTFGKFSGKTLPYVVLKDPEWFFWACADNAFRLRGPIRWEAALIAQRASHIRIPRTGDETLVADYHLQPRTRKIACVEVVPGSQELRAGVLRRPHLDLSLPRRVSGRDKSGGTIVAGAVKHYCLGGSRVRLTARLCEEFFSNAENFDAAVQAP